MVMSLKNAGVTGARRKIFVQLFRKWQQSDIGVSKEAKLKHNRKVVKIENTFRCGSIDTCFFVGEKSTGAADVCFLSFHNGLRQVFAAMGC